MKVSDLLEGNVVDLFPGRKPPHRKPQEIRNIEFTNDPERVKGMKKVPMHKVFCSVEYNYLYDLGYRMLEKPDSFEFIEQSKPVSRSVIDRMQLELGCRIPVLHPGEVFTKLNTNDMEDGEADVNCWPLDDALNVGENIVVVFDDYREQGEKRFFASRGANSYYRFWIAIA